MAKTVSLPVVANFVGGEWLESDRRRTLINRSTQEPIAVACEADVEMTRRAIRAARDAFDGGRWSGLYAEERQRILRGISVALMERADELAEIESANAGATMRTATLVHVGMALAHFDRYVDMATHPTDEALLANEHPSLASQFVVRDPVGVCGQIIPWNVPLLMAVWKIAPALAMGNTVVLKPAPATPLTAVELARVIEASELPAGVFNLVLGDVEPGEELARSSLVDKVAFTGSTKTGRRVMELAAGNIKKLTLELGGKSANIILDDADLDITIDGSIFAFTLHQGQFCESGTRLLVPEHMHDEFVDRMRVRLETMKIGPAEDWDTDLGPLINEAQLERVEYYVDLAQQEGAKVVCGGRRPTHLDSGWFYEPTIITNVDNSMRVAREEIFGPVVCVIPYRTEDEAVAIANDSEYGLAGGVFTGDVARGVRVARRSAPGPCGSTSGTTERWMRRSVDIGSQGWDASMAGGVSRSTPRPKRSTLVWHVPNSACSGWS